MVPGLVTDTGNVHCHTSDMLMSANPRDLQEVVQRIAESPAQDGLLQLIVRRPAVDAREVMEEAELDLALGLVGDTWSSRSSRRTEDGGPHPDMQLNVMNSRVLDAISGGDRSRWPLAGDQLIVDFDLTPENLPVGTQLAVGSAVIEVTDQPHTGCAKFADRFGVDALRFVNTGLGKERRYRGLNARVVTPGTIRQGDTITKR